MTGNISRCVTVALLLALAGCGGGGGYSAPAQSFETQSQPLPHWDTGAPSPIVWWFGYDANAGQMIVYFKNLGSEPATFRYRVSQREADQCVGGPFDFQVTGTAQVGPGEVFRHPIASDPVDQLWACMWGYDGGGALGGAPPVAQPQGPPSYQDLCYDLDCNGSRTGKQCFKSREEYCQSLCSSDNCLAPEACRRNCR